MSVPATRMGKAQRSGKASDKHSLRSIFVDLERVRAPLDTASPTRDERKKHRRARHRTVLERNQSERE